MAASPISERLREHKQAISDKWEVAVRAELAPLRALDNPALCDHLPELLEALALWVDGDAAAAKPGFDALADGHAVQRLGYGIDLTTLTREYALLRSVLIRSCLASAIDESTHEALARLNEGLDEAILGAVRRYMRGRDQLRDRFIGILAHDLRNPLNTISVAAGHVLMASEGVDSRLHEIGGMIARSTDRMSRMINDIIELAREHLGGGIPLELEPGDLGDICREAVGELVAGHPNRNVTISCTGDLTGFWDTDRVLQAISNVVGNALQHGEDPIRVTVSEHPDRHSIETVVTNAGRRPTPEELATIFDPLHGRRGPGSGLGLGLFIVRAVARAHGATCEVGAADDSTGFRFTIKWPRTPANEIPFRGTSPGDEPGLVK